MKPPKDKSRVYEKSEVVSFRSTDGPFGGLSNMAPGFPVIVNGVRIRSVEALYQALRYPHIPEAQQLIIEQHSPMTAKMVGRRYLEQTRADWDLIKVTLMRWCLRLKLAQNWDSFSSVLLSTGDRMIVEDSRKDSFWGAQPQEDGTLAGKNVLGRLLMELREQLKSEPDSLRSILRPQIPEAIFLGREIRTDSVMPDDSNLTELFYNEAPLAQKAPRMTTAYPKRLIEVDLPIKRISAHARRENTVRHGHFKTLHMWWARRPLAACRAVLCAMLWPDPADEHCPASFRTVAAEHLYRWALDQMTLHTADSAPVFSRIRACSSASALGHQTDLLRDGLFAFLADFADWERSKNPDFLATSRVLARAAHVALGGSPESAPRVFDPFAGGGSIPLEALRLGAESCASDLNPVAVLLNRMAIEQLPTHGTRLADAVREAGERIKERAVTALAPYFPADPDGATPITYLWARTVLSEAPDPTGEGIPVEIPLIRGFWLRKKAKRFLALRWVRDAGGAVVTDLATVTYADGTVQKVRQPRLEIFQPKSASELPGPVVQRGSATCPVTGHTTPVKSVRAQLKKRRGGTDDARLLAVATLHPSVDGRGYRLATSRDEEAIALARKEAAKLRMESVNGISIVPDEPLSPNELRRISIPIYGMERWGDLFSSRQLVALTTLRRLISEESARWAESESPDFARAVRTALAFALSKQTDLANGLCPWEPNAECPRHLFSRQAVPFVWDFAEGIPTGESSGSWSICVGRTVDTIAATFFPSISTGHVVRCSATSHWLPDDSAQVFFTDPPYYDAVPYAYLSDFFYVWLRRCLADGDPELARLAVVPKDEEIVVDRPHELSQSDHDIAYYERELGRAFAEAKRVLAHDGIGSIVFASKTTASWEAILSAVVNAGWVITASWPIDTEMETRVSAQGQARLASSVHLVVRPREGLARQGAAGEIGDWRDILQELPKRIHEWMPRLADEGVVGADAIFACLGPALEIFSRYRKVEKANGDEVKLGEYLEHVWAAVSREALSSITSNGDLTSLEPDARITAMWLWTLSAGEADEGGLDNEEQQDDEEEEEGAKKTPSKGGYSLEYDAARKIAQGLGASLEALTSVVEVKGDQARLLPVAERTAHLFGKDQAAAPGVPARGKKRVNQMDLFAELTGDHPGAAEAAWEEKTVSKPGATVLDRVHQAMILFATGRGDALKRFLVEDGVGREAAFWRLAQALSALYPGSSQEKRWVDGVLARKKGLGL